MVGQHKEVDSRDASRDVGSIGGALGVPATDWSIVGKALPSRFGGAPIHLIPSSQSLSQEELERLFPEANRIFAVDFYVSGAERGVALENGAGYLLGKRIVNIDHHAPDGRWERHISSGNLACSWVRDQGIAEATRGDIIVINHTDCDSVLASLILGGALPPHPRFEQAVLDADHRGAPHEIADLLQSCAPSRDLPSLIDALSLVLQGLPLPSEVQQQIEKLNLKRLYVRDLAQVGEVTEKNGVVLLECDRPVDSDLLLPVFPHARVIILGCRSDKHPELCVTRLRLGTSVESGVSLHRLGLNELDPMFGGRFNAGSNKRGLEEQVSSGATPKIVSAKEYFDHIVEKLGSVGRS